MHEFREGSQFQFENPHAILKFHSSLDERFIICLHRSDRITAMHLTATLRCALQLTTSVGKKKLAKKVRWIQLLALAQAQANLTSSTTIDASTFLTVCKAKSRREERQAESVDRLPFRFIRRGTQQSPPKAEILMSALPNDADKQTILHDGIRRTTTNPLLQTCFDMTSGTRCPTLTNTEASTL